MSPSESKQRLEQFIAASGCFLSSISGPEAARLMLGFYRQVRVANCQLDQEGDIIVFQWGPISEGKGEIFQYESIRQFIVPGDEDDDGMSELSLSVHYPVTDALRVLHGRRECTSPAKADMLESFILSHEATEAVASLVPLNATLTWNST